MDLHFLIFLFPAGVVLCFRTLRDEHVFVIIYAVVASYFAGVMVRLMLTLTPVVCVSAAVALSSLMDTYLDPTEPDVEDKQNERSTAHSTGTSGTSGITAAAPATGKKTKKNKDKETSAPASGVLGELVSNVASSVAAKSGATTEKGIFGLDTRLVVLLNSFGMLLFFVVHCTWVTSNAYSSPSVVLSSTSSDGSQHIIDDFREAYYWLRQNTAEDAVVMSWWDYGYQIAGMADRPTLVDNNTWNNSGFFT
jgi:dolichyl-diphosphooligosaccharide--protein glycosyltransferase